MLTKDKYGAKIVNYSIANTLNSLCIRPTDCSFTFDYQQKQLNNLERCLHVNVKTTYELYQILLLLNLDGLQNVERYFLHALLSKFKSTESIWDIRKIDSTIKMLKEK